MKKLMIVAIAVAMALWGCSSEEDDCVDPQPSNDNVEIKLNAGIPGMQTRAPVNTNDNITASFVASATTGDYTTNAWTSNVTFVASPTPTSALSFDPVRYYPVDNSSIYIKGYYPAGSLSGKTVTYSTPDGTKDVMITGQATGTKASTTPLAFTFSHLLTQLQFKFVSGNGYPALGNSVTKIVVKAQKIPATLDLNDASMTYTTGDVTFNGTYPITSSGAVAIDCPMVKSGESVVLSITTSDSVIYPDATITLTTETGKAHMITLTFTPKEITATASVTAWVIGGTGSSSLQ